MKIQQQQGHKSPMYNLKYKMLVNTTEVIGKNLMGNPPPQNKQKIGTENQALMPKRDVRRTNIFSVKELYLKSDPLWDSSAV